MDSDSNSNKKKYIPGEELDSIVDLAIELKIPLLVTGEPGTGKTQLAKYIAEEKISKESKVDHSLMALKFNTKTDSHARDLFYQYDAIRHFRDSNFLQSHKGSSKEGSSGNGNHKNIMNYIEFNALGQAIKDSAIQRRVVLIDEVDKAPRDFTNDLLHEFEEFSFQVKEAPISDLKEALGDQVNIDEQGFIKLSDSKNTPIVILTSNSEKNLPDAFMRRILYHHIPFPDQEKLKEIIHANIELDSRLHEKMLDAALEHFMDIRNNKRLHKKPATAELLIWLGILHREEIDIRKGLEASSDIDLKKRILRSYTIIAKNKEDMDRLKADLGL